MWRTAALTSLKNAVSYAWRLNIRSRSLTPPLLSAAPATKFNECYFGYLYSLEDTAVYGYMTPTRLKIVVALELTDSVVRDADIVSVSTFLDYYDAM